jgi:hypothetical protein
MVTVHADATIVLPIVATGLAQDALELARARPKPRFQMEGEFGVHWD